MPRNPWGPRAGAHALHFSMIALASRRPSRSSPEPGAGHCSAFRLASPEGPQHRGQVRPHVQHCISIHTGCAMIGSGLCFGHHFGVITILRPWLECRPLCCLGQEYHYRAEEKSSAAAIHPCSVPNGVIKRRALRGLAGVRAVEAIFQQWPAMLRYRCVWKNRLVVVQSSAATRQSTFECDNRSLGLVRGA